MFVVFIKNNIAIAKSIANSLKNIDLGVYDSCEEITEQEFKTMELPSKKVDGKWTKTSEVPKIQYTIHETEETEQPVSEIEQLRADIDYIAIMTGVEL